MCVIFLSPFMVYFLFLLFFSLVLPRSGSLLSTILSYLITPLLYLTVVTESMNQELKLALLENEGAVYFNSSEVNHLRI